MRILSIFMISFGAAFVALGQQNQLVDGTYTFDIAFAEWGGKSLGASCEVTIQGDSVTIINNGTLSGTRGEIIERGLLKKHKSGVWIIATSEEDEDAEEVGGCTGGPMQIDLENRKLWLC